MKSFPTILVSLLAVWLVTATPVVKHQKPRLGESLAKTKTHNLPQPESAETTATPIQTGDNSTVTESEQGTTLNSGAKDQTGHTATKLKNNTGNTNGPENSPGIKTNAAESKKGNDSQVKNAEVSDVSKDLAAKPNGTKDHKVSFADYRSSQQGGKEDTKDQKDQLDLGSSGEETHSCYLELHEIANTLIQEQGALDESSPDKIKGSDAAIYKQLLLIMQKIMQKRQASSDQTLHRSDNLTMQRGKQASVDAGRKTPTNQLQKNDNADDKAESATMESGRGVTLEHTEKASQNDSMEEQDEQMSKAEQKLQETVVQSPGNLTKMWLRKAIPHHKKASASASNQTKVTSEQKEARNEKGTESPKTQQEDRTEERNKTPKPSGSDKKQEQADKEHKDRDEGKSENAEKDSKKSMESQRENKQKEQSDSEHPDKDEAKNENAEKDSKKSMEAQKDKKDFENKFGKPNEQADREHADKDEAKHKNAENDSNKNPKAQKDKVESKLTKPSEQAGREHTDKDEEKSEIANKDSKKNLNGQKDKDKVESKLIKPNQQAEREHTDKEEAKSEIAEKDSNKSQKAQKDKDTVEKNSSTRDEKADKDAEDEMKAEASALDIEIEEAHFGEEKDPEISRDRREEEETQKLKQKPDWSSWDW